MITENARRMCPAWDAAIDALSLARRFDIANKWVLKLSGRGVPVDRIIRSVPEFQLDRPDNDMSMTDREIRIRHYMFWLLGWVDVPPVNIHNDPDLFKTFKYDVMRAEPEREGYSIKALADELGLHYNTVQDYIRGPRWGKLKGEWKVRRTDPLKAQGLLWLLLAPKNLPGRPLANLRRIVKAYHLSDHRPKGAVVIPPEDIAHWNESELYGWVLYGCCRYIPDAPDEPEDLAAYSLVPDSESALESLELQMPRLVEDAETASRIEALYRVYTEQRRAYLERSDHPENRTGADCDQPNHCAAIL